MENPQVSTKSMEGKVKQRTKDTYGKPAYQLSDLDMLQIAQKRISEEPNRIFEPPIVTKRKSRAKDLTPLAEKIITSHQDVIPSGIAENHTRLVSELLPIIKDRLKSQTSIIGSLYRNEKLLDAYVNVDGTIRVDDLPADLRSEKYAFLRDHKLSSKSKLRRLAGELAQQEQENPPRPIPKARRRSVNPSVEKVINVSNGPVEASDALSNEPKEAITDVPLSGVSITEDTIQREPVGTSSDTNSIDTLLATEDLPSAIPTAIDVDIIRSDDSQLPESVRQALDRALTANLAERSLSNPTQEPATDKDSQTSVRKEPTSIRKLPKGARTVLSTAASVVLAWFGLNATKASTQTYSAETGYRDNTATTLELPEDPTSHYHNVLVDTRKTDTPSALHISGLSQGASIAPSETTTPPVQISIDQTATSDMKKTTMIVPHSVDTPAPVPTTPEVKVEEKLDESVITSGINFPITQIYGVTKFSATNPQLYAIHVTDPKTGKEQGFHPGIDLGVPMNTPLYAISSGEVLDAGFQEAYGNYVTFQIKWNGEFYTVKLEHLNKLHVKKGDHIDPGNLLGISGNTGFSSGAHVHFEMRDQNGDLIDPATVFNFTDNDVTSDAR